MQKTISFFHRNIRNVLVFLAVIFLFVIIVLLVLFLRSLFSRDPVIERLGDLTYSINDQEIQFENGANVLEPDDEEPYIIIESEPSSENIAILRNNNEIGSAVYVAYIAETEQGLENTYTEYLGTNVVVRETKKDDQFVTINYMDFDENDFPCCPTQNIQRTYSVVDDTLQLKQSRLLGTNMSSFEEQSKKLETIVGNIVYNSVGREEEITLIKGMRTIDERQYRYLAPYTYSTDLNKDGIDDFITVIQEQIGDERSHYLAIIVSHDGSYVNTTTAPLEQLLPFRSIEYVDEQSLLIIEQQSETDEVIYSEYFIDIESAFITPTQ